MESDQRPKLTIREWGFLLVYALLLLSLVTYTHVYVPWFYPAIPEEPHYLVDPFIDVYISGEVQKPGAYRLPRNSTRGDLLTLAEPLPTADLRRIKTSVMLKQGNLLQIPRVITITVHFTGEIERPTTLTLTKGTKINEIKDQLPLKISANTSIFQKKRALKDGETITIKAISEKKREKSCEKTEIFGSLDISSFLRMEKTVLPSPKSEQNASRV